jgi:hypothetical protein
MTILFMLRGEEAEPAAVEARTVGPVWRRFYVTVTILYFSLRPAPGGGGTTAGPSATLGMTTGTAGVELSILQGMDELQIPRLRSE